jgi:hypothetical protein
VSYEDLLDLFWVGHDPTRLWFKDQYASVVLAADEDQLERAERSARAVEERLGRRVLTRIGHLDRFWPAENYHQKYYLRNDQGLMREFAEIYPAEVDFIASTAAARVNGYVAGDGTVAQLDREIDLLGLSDEGRARLLHRVGDTPASAECRIR